MYAARIRFLNVIGLWKSKLKNQRFFNREFVLTLAVSDTNIAGYWNDCRFLWRIKRQACEKITACFF